MSKEGKWGSPRLEVIMYKWKKQKDKKINKMKPTETLLREKTIPPLPTNSSPTFVSPPVFISLKLSALSLPVTVFFSAVKYC